jgi:hypothetical protein
VVPPWKTGWRLAERDEEREEKQALEGLALKALPWNQM